MQQYRNTAARHMQCRQCETSLKIGRRTQEGVRKHARGTQGACGIFPAVCKDVGFSKVNGHKGDHCNTDILIVFVKYSY